jgi:hypothetical protein
VAISPGALSLEQKGSQEASKEGQIAGACWLLNTDDFLKRN